jgi:succinoglycan biosynthesis transport protein ExoP
MNIFDSKNNFEWRDYFRILYRRKWYFLITCIIIYFIGGYWISIQKPTYDSFVVIEIKRNSFLGNLGRVIPGISDDYQRYVSLKTQIINSANLDRLIDRLNLSNDPKIRKAAQILQASVPNRDLNELIKFLLRKKLAKSITVNIFNDNVKITASAQSPDMAYLMVKTITDIFMETFLEREITNVESAQNFNTDQLEAFKTKLEESEKKLNDFKRRIAQNQNETKVLDQEAVDRINEAIVTVDLTMKAKNEHLDFLTNRLKGKVSGDSYPKTHSITLIHSEIRSKIKQMANLMTHFSWSSSEVVKVNRSINDLRDNILNEFESYYRGYDSKLDNPTLSLLLDKSITLVDLEIAAEKKENFKQVLENSENSILTEQATELTLSKLQQEVEINRKIYDLFLQQKQGTQIEEAIKRANESKRFNIIEPPRKPIEAKGTGRKLLAIITLCLGAGMGLGLVYLRELLDKSFHTVQEVENFFEIPVIGVISKLEQKIINPNEKSTIKTKS